MIQSSDNSDNNIGVSGFDYSDIQAVLDKIQSDKQGWNQQVEGDFEQNSNLTIDFSQSQALIDAIELENIKIFSQTYRGIGIFRGCNLPEVNFEKIKFKNSIDFREVNFFGDANFENAQFKSAYFTNTTFTQSAGFQKAQFKSADFRDATFTQSADFVNAQFIESADFINAKFKSADFKRAKFKSAHFGDAQFTQFANFTSAQFTKSADFTNAAFTQSADFLNTTFSQFANFSDAQFYSADFRLAKFNGFSRFKQSQFKKIVDFQGAEFNKVIDFENAIFEQPPDLRKTKLIYHFSCEGMKVYLKRDNSEFFYYFEKSQNRDDADKLRRLKELAAKAQDHEQEQNFFALELKAKRFHSTKGFSLIFSYFYQWCSDFGRSIARPVIGLIVTFFLFTGLYRAEDTFEPISNALQLSALKILPILPTSRILNSKLLENNLDNITGYIVVLGYLESVLGIIFIFLIGLALRNRFRI